MADFFDNFNNDPVSVAVKTNTINEAIAAGGYAKIVAVCKGTGQFFIDNSVALEAANGLTLTSSSMNINAGGQLNIDQSGVNDAPAYGFTNRDEVISETFWVPAGTNLKVTAGARYTIMLYNKQGN